MTGFFFSSIRSLLLLLLVVVLLCAPAHALVFQNAPSYIAHLSSQSELPPGFSVYTASTKFSPRELDNGSLKPINLCCILINNDIEKGRQQGASEWGGVFTKNKFPGAPILACRSRLESRTPLQALVINNKVSNVCAPNGLQNCEKLCSAIASSFNLKGGPRSVLPSSTGIIGWSLPVEELISTGVPQLVEKYVASESSDTQSDYLLDVTTEDENSLQPHRDGMVAARSIMTTDRYPKLRTAKMTTNDGKILGIAKGAGMIEPNLATMLSYIFTDVSCKDLLEGDQKGYTGKGWCQDLLEEAVSTTFNSISVDGDESTSDSVVLISSGKIKCVTMDEVEEFRRNLKAVCSGLASDVVRNGEGTRHVIQVNVRNFPTGSDADARALGKRIVNSPLFKCAVSGNDPNIGRLAAAVGSFMGKLECKLPSGWEKSMSMKVGGTVVFEKGAFALSGEAMERELSEHMQNAEFGEHDDYPQHERNVLIDVEFKKNEKGKGDATILGSDLTNEYVKVNADYRS